MTDPPEPLLESHSKLSFTAPSTSNCTTQNKYVSPLEKTLAELRRKYVAAAGPQVGGVNDPFLMEYSSSFYSRDIDGDDVEKKITEEEHEQNKLVIDSSRRGITRAQSTVIMSTSISRSNSMSFYPTARSSLLNSSHRYGTSTIFLGGMEHNHPHRPTPLFDNTSISDQESTTLSNRKRSGLASSSHAENLLASVPHLRHLSQASIHMQGLHIKKSHNPLAYILASAYKKTKSVDTSTTGGDSSNAYTVSMAEYKACLDHERANHIAASQLAAFVRILSHEMSLEEYSAVEAEIFSHILTLMHSDDEHERLAGVAAIDALIGVTSADEEKKSTKFAKNLSYAMKAVNVDFLFLSGITKSLGKIFLRSSNVDYVEYEVIKAIEWLKKERSDRRLAAVLSIKELAKNAPAAFYSKMNQSVMNQGGTNEFLHQLFPVLRDAQPIVRTCGADALAECLKIIVDPSRKHHSTTAILCQIYSFVMEGFKINNKTQKGLGNSSAPLTSSQIEAAQHSSLLIVSDLLERAGSFMLPRFGEVCDAVLALKYHPKEVMRLEVLRLIPRLAQSCPGAFVRRYLGASLTYVMECSTEINVRAGVDIRPTAYFSLGQLALAVNDGNANPVPVTSLQIDDESDVEIVPADDDEPKFIKYHMKKGDIYSNISNMFHLVRVGLGVVQSEALHCGADLVQALGLFAEPYVSNLLDDMFKSGISEDLIACLHSIAHSVPSKMGYIENRLMQELSLSLAGTTAVKKLCDPLNAYPNALDEIASGDYILLTSSSSTPSVIINMAQDEEVVAKLVLSLKTMGTLLNMEVRNSSSQSALSWTLLPFLRDVVSCYLLHPSSDVRKEAGLTCCLLLLPSNDSNDPRGDTCHVQLGPASVVLVEEVMQKLLCVAVSDSSPMVRNTIIRGLDRRYDKYLSQSQHLPTLFLCLQDEVLAVRIVTLRLLGRLARLNPAPILPELRQFLRECIIELRCNGDTGAKEAVTRLLIIFFQADALHRLVHPFLASIIDALPLQGATPRLASAALEAIGELSNVVKDDIKPWLHQLLPFIMEPMQDQSSSNRQLTSLKTLGKLSGNTKYVIDPFLEYPQLLSQAAAVLPGTKRAPWALRQEVIRTLGILGALDPDRFPTTTGSKARKGGGIGSGYFVDTDEDKSRESIPLRVLNGGKEIIHEIKRNDPKTTKTNELIRLPDKPYSNEDIFVNTSSSNDGDEPAHFYMYELYSMTAQPISKISPPRRLTPTDENFYPTVSLQALTTILKDPSLAVHHGMVMQAVMFIFNSLGLRCVPFLKGIVPHIIHTARTCGQATLREALLQQVANLSGIVKENLHSYVPEIFEVVHEFWDSKHLATVLLLIQKIASGVPADFKQYVPNLVSRFLSSIDDFSSGNWMKSKQISSDAAFERLELINNSIRNIRSTLGDYFHVLLPALLKLTNSLINPTFDYGNFNSQSLSKLAVDSVRTIGVLLQSGDGDVLMGVGANKLTGIGTSTRKVSNSLSARAAQPLIRILSQVNCDCHDVGLELIQAICICAELLGRDQWIPFYHIAAREAIFVWHQQVESSASQAAIENAPSIERRLQGIVLYDEVIRTMVDSVGNTILHRILYDVDEGRGNVSKTSIYQSDSEIQNSSMQSISNQTNKHRVNQVNLQRAWDVSQRATREEWDEWMRRFALQLLREAPAPSLRACAELAYAYQPLARELFSAAFASCWTELSEQYRMSLVNALKTAFFADASPEILQTLLNLAEYAERDGIPGGLPIEIDILAELALKCRAYAKALHYKELEHELSGGSSCIEDLISINKKLDLPEAALGVLKAAQLQMERHGNQSWKLSVDPQETRKTYDISSRIFHRHQGEGLAYSIMTSSDEISAQGKISWASVDMQASWLAKLGAWVDALTMYERTLEQNTVNNIEAVLGCMKCFDARGEWGRVLELADSISDDDANVRDRRKASRFCAQAAYRLGQWDDLEMYSAQLIESRNDQYQGSAALGAQRVDFDGAFFGAIVNIHRKEWKKAQAFINSARRAMDSRFTALMAESHKRAYSSMVTAQILAEMEEIIAFRKLEARAKAGRNRHPTNRDDEEKSRQQLLALWRKRLAGCRVDAEVHSSILAVRSLVLSPTDEINATLSLSRLLRQAQFYKFSETVLLEPIQALGVKLDSAIFGYNTPQELGLGLINLSNSSHIDTDNLVKEITIGDVRNFFPQYGSIHDQYTNSLILEAGGLEKLQVVHRLYYEWLKYLWAVNSTDDAMYRLTRLANIVDLIAHSKCHESDLRVKCWNKLGEWMIAQSSPGTPLSSHKQYEILVAFKRSTAFTSHGYRSWHNWALINFRLAQQCDDSKENVLSAYKFNSFVNQRRTSGISSTLQNHVCTAVHAFIKAICLGSKRWSASVQQDLLNFLTCLFRYGESREVASVISSEIGSVALEAWLGVLPQLLARIQINSPIVRSILHPLLVRLGQKHPQALMYPLSVLIKSPVVERKAAADSLMNSLKKHSYALVEDSLMVSSELIRVAILWLEQWHEGLEDASRLYFGEGNVSGMLDVLLPLHETLERGPATRREQDFYNAFGTDLAEAHAFVKEYIRLVTRDGGVIPKFGGFMPSQPEGISNVRQKAEAEAALNHAWDTYYTVFRRINKQLPSLTTLELSHCSPALLQARNLELGVPGSYRVDGSYVKIERFYPTVQVITSKQRPRKIVLKGGDGKDYVFLLKGHEDLRQDERVMQLFGLVNALLARDRRTNNHDLNIQRYTITPLSHNAVVGWVPHTDTLHSLIRDYRESKRIPLNMENREMVKLANDYDLLTVMQKIEVFSEALDQTTGKGNDLYEVLWQKSINSEEWLDRRTKYTRSLSVMSMVGYVLGLGDRHPSNLMLDQISGRVLHIDFGDCFEVAMNREKFPEKIPFRLTRMLIKAMEVSGVEGSYRSTCERTMAVLRDNRDSLVAMLEAFVYDPLISWRLLSQEANVEKDQSFDSDSPNIACGPTNNRLSTSTHSRRNLSFKPSQSITHETILEAKEDFTEDEKVSGQRQAAVNYNKDRTAKLKMYSDIQNMVANMSVDSRIASITGGGKTMSESISHSRLALSVKQRQAMSLIAGDAETATGEALNEKALKVIRRVQDKLTGTDFQSDPLYAFSDSQGDALDVQDQVQRLIVQATSTENLCQLFIGWCAFW